MSDFTGELDVSNIAVSRNLKKILAGLAIAGLIFPASPPRASAGAKRACGGVRKCSSQPTGRLPGCRGSGAARRALLQRNPSPAESRGEPQILHLMVGRSLVITSPTRIKRVSVADPTIADAIVVSPNQVLVNGKVAGGVSLLLWDESDQSQAFEVSVDIDILSLSEKIHEVFPNEQVQIETSKDSVILSGHASSQPWRTRSSRL